MTPRLCIFAIILVNSLTTCYSQSLIPYRNSYNKWGYCNKNKEIVIPCEFDRTYPIVDHLGKFEKNGKTGYVNEFGKIVCQPIYDEGNFSNNGRALVKKDLKFGYINAKGKEIIPLIYDKAENFHKGYAEVFIKDTCGIIDINGSTIVPFKYLNVVGKVEFNDGFIPMLLTPYPDLKFVYVDKKGVVLNGKTFKQAQPFNNHHATVRSMETSLFGAINKKGILVVPYDYEWGLYFENGQSVARKNGHSGVIDTLNKIIIPFEYDGLQILQKGFYLVKKGSVCFVINAKNERLNALDYEEFKYTRDGVTPVKKNGYWGYIGPEGKELSPFIYTAAEQFTNKYGALYEDEAIQLINLKGEIEMLPEIFSFFDFENIYNGIIRVAKYNKSERRLVYGIRNLNGKQLELKYCDVLPTVVNIEYKSKYLVEGLILVESNPNGEMGYIDLNGNEYWEKTKNDIDFESRITANIQRRYEELQINRESQSTSKQANISFNKIYSEYRTIDHPKDVKNYSVLAGGSLNFLVSLDEINIFVVGSKRLVESYTIISSENTVFEGAPAIHYHATNKSSSVFSDFYFINELNTCFIVESGYVSQFKGY